MAYQSTNYSGIRYREHPTRKHGITPDRYFTIRYQKDGKRHEKGLGWASRGWSVSRAAEVLAEIKKAQRIGDGSQTLKERREAEEAEFQARQAREEAEKRDCFTFGELAAHYFFWAQSNKKSHLNDSYRYQQHLHGPLGKRFLKDITSLDLEGLKWDLQKTLAPPTVKHCLVLVRQMFNKAVLWGLYTGPNPVKGVKLPALDNRRTRRFLSREEAQDLLEELKTWSLQTHDQAFVSLYAGLRFGEIAGLTWRDIDFEQGIIHIRDGKARSRHAYMISRVRDLLQARRPATARPEDLIFQSRTGGRQRHVSSAFRKAVDSLGLNAGRPDPRDRVCFHTLRHSFASWLAIQGTPLLTIKELLGHRTLAMTARYAHLAPDCQRTALNHLEAAFCSNKLVMLKQ